MRPFLFFLSCLPGLALAEACIVHSQAKNLDVKVCQQNRSIPAKLFREGFCQPQLQGQKVEVTFAEGRLRCLPRRQGTQRALSAGHLLLRHRDRRTLPGAVLRQPEPRPLGRA